MATNLDYMIAGLVALKRRAIALSGDDHFPEDAASILKDVGGRLETFLKEHVVPGQGDKLVRLIDALAGIAVPRIDIDALHDLRLSYNSAKHDPAFVLKAEDVCKHIENAIRILGALRNRHVATSDNERSVSQYSRSVWIAGWDHFIHGDSEVHIYAPIDEEGLEPPLLDLIYVNGKDWPNILKVLGPKVVSGDGSIPKKFMEAWDKEGDFAGGYVFRGEYRELLRALAQNELRLEILPQLKRESDAVSVRTAMAFALVDAAGKGLLVPTGVDAVLKAALGIGEAEYSVPPNAPLAYQSISAFRDLLARLPVGISIPSLRGPRFISKTMFDGLSSYAMVMEQNLMITQDFEFVVMK